ncbi:MAG: terminase large subunit domain-containing protein [Eubacteriales bacterium]
MDNIVWKPQPRQAEFMMRAEDEALYGGAAGGGKSDALVIEATRQVHIPYYKALIIRKTFPQLTELIEKSQRYYSVAFPKAKYNEAKHTWTFPSGAKIVFGSMQHTKDKLNYQGKAYDFIAFDELTHFTYDEYIYLKSRNRPNGPGTRCYIRSTANPGGVGHGWVKERFITAAKPMTTIWEKVIVHYPDGRTEEKWSSRVFVPSSVFDNKILLENDPDYLARLASMPEAEKKALLYGDWDSFSGQYFAEWRDSPDIKLCHEAGISPEEALVQRRFTHVIEPFNIPRGWNIMRSYDFGYNKPFSLQYWAVDYDGVLYNILEFYGCTQTPNEGVKWTPEEQFRRFAELESQHSWLKGRKIVDSVADPSIWDTSRGPSTAEIAEKYGIYFTPGDNERVAGWLMMRYYLQFDENGYPRMYFFNNCKAARRTIPLMLFSETHPEDLDSDLEDHACDSIRYMCMSRPIKPLATTKHEPIVTDPLNQFSEKQHRRGYI